MKKYIVSFLSLSLLNQMVLLPASAAQLSLSQQPLQVTEYIEPNVMLLLDTSGSMAWDLCTGCGSRLQVMKVIATALVQDNDDIRFCLARFRYDQGGTILSECGSSNANIQEIVTNIAALPALGGTPLAEAYYEVINYFAGKSPKYINLGEDSRNDDNLYVSQIDNKYVSPVQYRCQKNYAIVLTDGAPSLDYHYPGFSTTDRNYGNFSSYWGPTTGPEANYDEVNNDGGSGGVFYFLDDMAKYAWDTDLRINGQDGASTDLTGASFDSSDFPPQNLATFTVAFTLTDPSSEVSMLKAAASYGEGGNGTADSTRFLNANNSAALTAAFQSAIDQIVDENRTTTEATANSDLLSSAATTYVFQTQFTSNKWTGELIGYQFVKSTDGSYSLVKQWAAPDAFPTSWGNRVVDSGLNSGVPLKWSKLTDAQKLWFDEDGDGTATNIEKQRLNYIRGKTATAISASNYRARESLMGDIINSSPLYVGPPTASEYENTDLESSFAGFITSKGDRDSMVYVGANDGLLHAFDTNGNEKMAFAPSKVIPNLLEYSQEEYSHQFYVDGSPTAANVIAEFVTGSNSWRTVLVGGLRRGGQGIYALDITDPSRFANGNNSADDTRAAATLLWEFSDDVALGATANDKYTADADLGYTYSDPQIMRLNDGNFYVVLGNGYNSTEADGNASTTGDAILYLLNIATGEVFKKMSTQTGMEEDPNRPPLDPVTSGLGNGLATVTGFDGGELSGGYLAGKADGKIDYVYAGDLFGNIWKFDLSSDDPNNWGTSAPTRLFTAQDASAQNQPVTSQIEAVRLSNNEIMLYFGTGKLLEQFDAQTANISTQTFYGIVDSGTTLLRSNLLQQSIDFQGDYTFSGISKEIRLTTDHTRSSTQQGWYMDLQKPVYASNGDLSYENEGEQVIVGARFIDNYVYFITNISNQDACLTPVEKNYLMVLSARSGASLNDVVIDTNEDGTIDKTGDNVTLSDGSSKSVSGRTGFGTQLPIIIKTGDVSDDGSEGGVICDVNNDCHKVKSPKKSWTRLSWEEIRTD